MTQSFESTPSTPTTDNAPPFQANGDPPALNADPQRARRYARAQNWFALASVAQDLALSVGYISSGAARTVQAKLLPRHGRGTFRQRAQLLVAHSLARWAVTRPLSYLAGFRLEHRYGLGRQSHAAWASDQVKGEAMSLPIEVLMIEGLWWTQRRFPQRWWLVCAGAIIPVSAAAAALVPVLILPRFNSYTPLEDQELAERLRDLAERAGIPVSDVLQMDMSRRTSKANAFFMGIGRTRRIVLADTLLANSSHAEIEGVVAHELGHQANGDIWRGVALAAGFTLVSAWLTDGIARRMLRRQPHLLDTTDIADPRALPLVTLVLSLVSLASGPLQQAYSRAVERRTDQYAIALTGNTEAFASALERLSDLNLSDPEPPRWVVWLLHSHPPLRERVRHLRGE